MTKVLRLTLCSKYAQVDIHWETLCLVPCSAAEGRHMVSMMSLLSDQASSPICNFNENQTPALQLISTPRINNNEEKKHSPYWKNWSHPYPITKAQAVISDVTQKKGTLYPSLDSDLLRWRTKLKQRAGGNISSDAEAQALAAPDLCRLQRQPKSTAWPHSLPFHKHHLSRILPEHEILVLIQVFFPFFLINLLRVIFNLLKPHPGCRLSGAWQGMGLGTVHGAFSCQGKRASMHTWHPFAKQSSDWNGGNVGKIGNNLPECMREAFSTPKCKETHFLSV